MVEVHQHQDRLADSDGPRHVFSSTRTLSCGQVVVVFGGGDVTNFNALGNGTGVLANTGSIGLNNSSDTITIADAGGAIVDSFAYSSGGAQDGDGETIAKDPENPAGTFAKLNIKSNDLKYRKYRIII